MIFCLVSLMSYFITEICGPFFFSGFNVYADFNQFEILKCYKELIKLVEH